MSHPESLQDSCSSARPRHCHLPASDTLLTPALSPQPAPAAGSAGVSSPHTGRVPTPHRGPPRDAWRSASEPPPLQTRPRSTSAQRHRQESGSGHQRLPAPLQPHAAGLSFSKLSLHQGRRESSSFLGRLNPTWHLPTAQAGTGFRGSFSSSVESSLLRSIP